MNRPVRSGPPCSSRAAKGIVSCGVLALLLSAVVSSAQTSTNSPAALTNVQQVVEFGLERARTEHPSVVVEGVVTFLTRRNDEMFIHDATAGVVVRHTNRVSERFVGQRVRVSGELQAGLLAPFVNRAHLEVLGTAPMPEPLRVPLPRLHAGEFAARWVEVNGVIRDVVQEEDFFILSVRSAGSRIPLFVMGAQGKPLPLEWLDAPVTLQGVSWPEVDREGKHIGTWINLADTRQLHVGVPALTNVFAQPALPIITSGELRRLSDVRRKISGTVLHQSPGGRIFLRDDTGAAQAELLTPLARSTAWANLVPRAPSPRLQPGDQIELVGAPMETPFAPLLIDAEFRLVGRANAAPSPSIITAKAALSGKFDGELVTLRAKVVGHNSLPAGRLRQEILSLEGDGNFFEAIWETTGTNHLPAVEGKSMVEVTGICAVHAQGSAPLRSFHLLLRDPAGLRVVGPAPWWSSLQPGKILLVSGLLGALALIWIALLGRQIAQRKRAEAATRAVNYFATSLLERHNEEEILWDLARNCVAQLGFVDCVVYLLDERQNALIQKAAFGPKNPHGEQILNLISIPVGQGIVGTVAASGRAEIIPDTRMDSRYIVDDKRRLSEITVPIVAGSKVLGVIDSEHPAQNFFTREHLEILTSIASLCANKLARVRAEQQLRTMNAQLESRVAERTADLRASEARKAAVLETALDSIITIDALGRIIDFNPAAEKTFGYPRGEVIGREMAELIIPPEMREHHRAGLRRAVETGVDTLVGRRIEVPALRRGGGQFTVELALARIVTDAGPIFTAHIQDISERKRGESIQRAIYQISAAVHAAEDLKSLYARIHEAVRSVMPAENFFLLLHNPANELHEYVYHVDQMDPWPSPRKVDSGLVGHILRTGKSLLVDRESMTDVRNEWHYVSGTPSAVWLGVPLLIRGETMGVMAVQDYQNPKAYGAEEERILTYMATQAALAIEGKRSAEELARFAAIADATSDLVGFSDLDGHVIYINRAGRRMIGREETGLLRGLTLMDFVAPASHEFVNEVLIPTALREGSSAAEIALCRPDGTEVHVSTVSMIIPDAKGRPAYLAGIMRDISQRKRVESELERALAHEKELSELKSRFVSMVSHEFRTPLGIIMSSAEILDAYLDRLPIEERRSNLRDISESSKHMASMMEEVLLLGRAEAGKMSCRPMALDLGVLCAKLADEVNSSTTARCRICLTVPPGLGEAMADESLLRHILTNLLTNAVKYSPEGSTVEFIIEAKENLAVFTVRDRGIGIPEADQRQVFQAFHRGRNVGEVPGTGLGMVIVKHCVQLHGGRIAFESREGQGTTFIVALPLFGPANGSGQPSGTTYFLRATAGGSNVTIIP